MSKIGWKKTLYFVLSAFVAPGLLFPLTANALEGVEKATVLINGEPITIVVGNKDRRDDIYYLKKALKGDVEAREIFLQGKEERILFVGEDSPLWLRVTMNNEEIFTSEDMQEKWQNK